MHTNDLRKLARETNDGVLRGPALGAADEIDRLRAEIERLTKERDEAIIKAECWEIAARKMEAERDEALAENRFTLGLLDRTMIERDEARAQVVGAFEAAASVAWADRESGLTVNTKIRALTPDDAQAALQSMLADAERDMRQRAADSCLGLMTAQSARKFILALPLKHADRENDAALAQGQKEGE